MKQIIAAIHNLQQEVGVIPKNRTATIPTSKGSYSYKYADLTDIWMAIKPLLNKHGLTIVQAPAVTAGQGFGTYYKTTIYHESGEVIEEYMNLVTTKEDPQSLGAAITYTRRYMLSSMLGLFTDEDTDAHEHKLATAEDKKSWLAAYKTVSMKQNPDHTPTYGDFIKFVTEVSGKPMAEIRAEEAADVLSTIKAFED